METINLPATVTPLPTEEACDSNATQANNPTDLDVTLAEKAWLQTFEKITRWTVCAPLGLMGGALVGFLSLLFVEFFLSDWWLPGCIGYAVTGLILPLAVYRIGMAIAPDEGTASSTLAYLPNGLLAVVAFIGVAEVFSGGSAEGVADTTRVISESWRDLAMYGAMLPGCWLSLRIAETEEGPDKWPWDV